MLTELLCRTQFFLDCRVTAAVTISAKTRLSGGQNIDLRFFSEDPAEFALSLNGEHRQPVVRNAGTGQSLSFSLSCPAGDNSIDVHYTAGPRFLSEAKKISDCVWVLVVPLRQFRMFGVDDSIRCELEASLPQLGAAEKLLFRKRSLTLGGKSDYEERGVLYASKIRNSEGSMIALYAPGFAFPDQLSIKAGSF